MGKGLLTMSDTQFIPASESVIAAAERHRARIEAVAHEDIVYVYADPHSVVKTVTNAEPKYMAFRPRMAALAGEVDLTLVDDCASYARAYMHAASELAEEAEEDDAAALYEEGLKTRELFATVRSSLGKAQVTSNTPHLRSFAGRAGRDEVSSDLFKHVVFFEKEWQNLEGKVPITKADVERAEFVGRALMREPRKKGGQPLSAGSPQLTMYQAGTLLLRAYAEVRRAIVFLRGRQGDADEIAPPLYSGRTPPKKSAKAPADAQPEAPAQAQTAEPDAPAAPPAPAATFGPKGSTPFTV
jgi:hypothetical protein